MKYHYLPDVLEFGDRSLAYWSRNPSGRVLLFVHGFGFGRDPEAAWRGFPDRLLQDSRFGGADLLFFGYRGTPNYPPVIHSTELYRLLDRLFSGLPKDLSERLRKSRDALIVRHLLMVGHSLGAVVARKALVRAFTETKDWRDTVSLAFFAPAHCGARVVRAYGSALSSISFIPLARAAAEHFLVLPELLAEGSEFLGEFEAEVASLQAATGGEALVPRFNLFGSTDKVVTIRDFGGDNPLDVAMGEGHVSVCKPSSSYSLPFDLVGKEL